MSSILTICPSRIRPELLLRMIDSFNATKRGEDTCLVIYVDEEDPRIEDYNKIEIISKDVWIEFGPRLPVGHVYNHMIKEYSEFDFYSMANDDFVYRTIGWDIALMGEIYKKFNGIGCANSDSILTTNNYHEHRHPSGCVISKEIVQALGYLFHPTITHYRTDSMLRDILEGIERYAYVPEVIIEHVHRDSGKAEDDENYRNQYDSVHKSEGDKAYNEWRINHMAEDIERVKQILK